MIYILMILLSCYAFSTKINLRAPGPQLMYPMRGEFIDLTAKPYLVDYHNTDNQITEQANSILSTFLKQEDIDSLNNQGVDINSQNTQINRDEQMNQQLHNQEDYIDTNQINRMGNDALSDMQMPKE